MLRELRVKNLALIEDAHVSFSKGLTVLTGETGAGKSILIGALNLILGARAAGDAIRSGVEEAEVEALFDSPRIPRKERDRESAIPAEIEEFLSQEEILIRRVVSRSGKNRITVNGRLTTLSLLETLGESLVDFHRQNQHQTLRDRETQIALLDDFSGLAPLRRKITEGYLSVQRKRQALEEVTARERERAQREDFLRFQEQEIAQAGLKSGEDESLLRERKILVHGEKLSSLCRAAYESLYEEERSVLSRLRQCEGWLREIAEVDPAASDMGGCMASIVPQLQDLVHTLRNYEGRIDHDPGKLAQMEDRLHQIERLKKKYGSTADEILRHLDDVKKELLQIETAEEEIRILSREVDEETKALRSLAAALSEQRRTAAVSLAKEVDRELSHLGMAAARFRVQVSTQPEEVGPNGADQVDLLISTNPGEEPKPLARIASGGELSRVMLAVKAVLASADRTPTLIFDEIDTGIGGKVAEEVGIRLKRLAKSHQVACITHLPQIASLADHHYGVEKTVQTGRTTVQVRPLNDQERVEEVARMLGGKTITKTTRRHAEEMLGR